MPESVIDESDTIGDESEKTTETARTRETGETVTETATGKREILDADLLPSFGTDSDAAVDIEIYVVTGRHGIFEVPESFCRECHMFARRADMAAEEVDAEVDVSVYSWWTRFLGALRHGGYHPPVMVVGGTRLCQGHDVPTTDEVVDAIADALD